MKENKGKVSNWFKDLDRKCTEGMAGRNGIDGLNILLFVLYVVLIFLGAYYRIYWICGCALAILIWLLFRTFSKDLEKRRKENAFLIRIRDFIRKKRHFLKQKHRDRKTYVYKKCPQCKKMLRVKKKKGTRTINCPHCNKEIKIHCSSDAKVS